MTWLLKDWYGDEERACLEVLDHLPGVERVDSLIEEVVKANMTPEQMTMRKLRENWRQIVGAQIAAVTQPVRITDHIVYAEVSHPAYLRELSGRMITRKLVDGVNRKCGEGFCAEIRFMPVGR